MKRVSLFLMLMLVSTLTGLAQQPLRQSNIVGMKVLGQAVADQFGRWSLTSSTRITSTGSFTVRVDQSYVIVPDGTSFQPISTTIPLTINDTGNDETVTPSAVNCQQGSGLCTFTATFAAKHTGGFTITSGTNGLQEAINAMRGSGGWVQVTPDWNGTTSMITNTAVGTTSVGIHDTRSGMEVWYGWNGSHYALIFSLTSSTSGLAPASSKYVINTADAALPNAQVLAVLTTGFLKVTNGTGLLSSTTLHCSDLVDDSPTCSVDGTNAANITSGTLANVRLVNNGALTVAAGTGMSGGGSVALGGTITLTNAGVTSLTGTANRVTVSASTGAITLSGPQDIATGSSPTFAGLTVSGLAGAGIQCVHVNNSGVISGTGSDCGAGGGGGGNVSTTGLNTNGAVYGSGASNILSTAAMTDGQVMIGKTGNAPTAANLTAGTGITITNGANSITITNPGVTSITAGAALTCAPATGSVTCSLTNPGTGIVTSNNGTLGVMVRVAAASGGTNIDTSASTGLPYLTSSGVWSVSTTQSPQITKMGVGTAAVNNFGIVYGGTVQASAGTASAEGVTVTLQASTNNDVLAGLFIKPTFDDNGKTGVSHFAIFSPSTELSSWSGPGRFPRIGINDPPDPTYSLVVGALGTSSPLSGSLNNPGIYSYMLSNGDAYIDAAVQSSNSDSLRLRAYSNGFVSGITIFGNGSVAFPTVGTHSIGGNADPNTLLYLTGTFTSASNIAAFRMDSTLQPVASADAYGMILTPTLTEAGSNTHNLLAFLRIAGIITNGAASAGNTVAVDVATYTAGAGTTIASGFRVAAPSGASTNYAINVLSGNSSFGGDLLPDMDNTRSIGSTALRYSEIYLDPAATGVGDTFICLKSDGQVRQGATCAASSERFKSNIQPLVHGLDWVMQMQPVTWTWTQPSPYGSTGLTAERMAAIDSSLAIYQDGQPYSIDERAILASAINAIKELKLENERLMDRLSKVESK